jgi:LDH2 family malate/lactate/ureidoglycolate dehydrogenase
MAGNLTFDELKSAAGSGDIDTVLVCCVDMQGRIMGKRFHVQNFIDSSHEETHCCNYMLATDLEMATPGRLRDHQLAGGLRRLCDEAGSLHDAPRALARGHRNGAVRSSRSPHP